MDAETLLELANSIRETQSHVSRLARERLPEAEPIVEQQAALLEDLVAEIEARERKVARLTEHLADQLNNLLMSVQTASDLLRNPPDDAAAARLRQHLDATVGSGRESLVQLRNAVGSLR